MYSHSSLPFALLCGLCLAACGAEDPSEASPPTDSEEPSLSAPGKADNAKEDGDGSARFTGELAWLEPFCADDELFGAIYAECHPGVELMRIQAGQRRPEDKQRFFYPASEEFDLWGSVDSASHVRVVYCMHDIGCELPEDYVEVIAPEHWALVFEEHEAAWKIILRDDFHTQQYDPETNEVAAGTLSTEPYRGGNGKGFFWVLYTVTAGG